MTRPPAPALKPTPHKSKEMDKPRFKSRFKPKTKSWVRHLTWLLATTPAYAVTPPEPPELPEPTLELPLELQGEAVQGGMMLGRTIPRAEVFFNGSKLRLSPQGNFVFGFGRDAPSRAVLRVAPPKTQAGTQAGSEPLNKVIEVRERRYPTQRIDGLDERKVTPRAEDLERIREESRQVALARERDDPRTDFLGGFAWPVHGVVTGVYGSQRILNGQRRRPHFGVDLACRAGAPVKAPAAGVVTLVHDGMFFSGATLIVDHGHGLSSAFLHLRKILVETGERVERGQVIAEVGASGRVTGAHLDWRVNWFETRLDPALLAGEMPEPAPECRQ